MLCPFVEPKQLNINVMVAPASDAESKGEWNAMARSLNPRFRHMSMKKSSVPEVAQYMPE